jgi:riboflavin kinase / FMN adenylyltransferase
MAGEDHYPDGRPEPLPRDCRRLPNTMKVITDREPIPAGLRGAVVALGNFDGVHRGHQSVLGKACKIARARAVPVGAMTFVPHPRIFFKPLATMFVLTTEDRKQVLLDAFGLDFSALLTFDRALADLTASEFVDQVLAERWGVSHIVVGYNFFFGKGRGGSPQVLEELGKTRGFEVTVVAPARDDGEVFSSSSVRDYLRAGDVRDAAEILGHWWAISGTVEKGAQLGTSMGYPTVNVMLQPGQALHHGIYAARVIANGRRYDGAAYNGRRPTFDNGIAKLEVFLFDFSGDLYGAEITVELIDFIRPDAVFDSAEALMAKMAEDCAKARTILDAVNADDPMLKYPIGRALAERYGC